jgi:hypothetical protein
MSSLFWGFLKKMKGGVKMKSKKLSYNKILVLFSIIVVLVLMTGCNEPPPIEIVFSADPSTIYPGESSILTWNTFMADTVTISPDVGAVDPSGSTSVSPAVTTVYTLAAHNTSGGNFAWVTVTVIPLSVNGLYGTIDIKSTPSGAEVYLDGKDTGETTPTTLTAVEVGEHTIKLIYFHYQAWQTYH